MAATMRDNERSCHTEETLPIRKVCEEWGGPRPASAAKSQDEAGTKSGRATMQG